MTVISSSPAASLPKPTAAGLGDGVRGSEAVPAVFVILDPVVEWMRYCDVCGSEERFVAGWECRYGLLGCCSTCGAEAVIPFTRANSEA
jgi:hypothetical protein